MEIRPRVLREEVMECLNLVDATIDEVKKECRTRRIMPHELRDTNGSWILIPLVVAKAQCLATLQHLNKES